MLDCCYGGVERQQVMSSSGCSTCCQCSTLLYTSTLKAAMSGSRGSWKWDEPLSCGAASHTLMDTAQVKNDHLDQYLVIDDGDKFSLSGGAKELAFVMRGRGERG